jgi:ABC-type Mn2+/Zn2+ transport system ATPase subunit
VFRARDLALGYGGRSVLEHVDFEVGKGEFWFFLGPNGSGKTTLVRALLRELSPSAGELALDTALGVHEAIGFVPQRGEINPTLPTTLQEFTSLGLVGVASDREEERVATALAEVGLAGLARDDFSSLSGGQRQRALLARALVREPRTLLLDEPTTGLDLAAEHGLLLRLRRLNEEQQLTIVVVTHEIELAARYASHVALFHDGGVTAGARDDVLSGSRIGQIYGLRVRIDADGVHVLGEAER